MQRDPAFVARYLGALDLALTYFDPEIQGFDRVPQHGPMLLVGNHSGGIYMPDFWAFLRHWARARGSDDALYTLSYDLLFVLPGIRSGFRRLGLVPASRANASQLLAAGQAVLVYPGGDMDAYRPWRDRNRVELCGHTGFVRLALQHQVPIVPVVSHGSHEVMIILARGDKLARRFGLNRLRINVLPLVAGPPGVVATWPLPSKVIVRVCEPLDWGVRGLEAAADPMVVRTCYEEVLNRMQTELDELVHAVPYPVATRVLGVRRRSVSDRARPDQR